MHLTFIPKPKPLWACYLRNMSPFVCVCVCVSSARFPLKLVNETMSKEVRDKVAGPSFSAVYLLCQGLRDYTVSAQ